MNTKFSLLRASGISLLLCLIGSFLFSFSPLPILGELVVSYWKGSTLHGFLYSHFKLQSLIREQTKFHLRRLLNAQNPRGVYLGASSFDRQASGSITAASCREHDLSDSNALIKIRGYRGLFVLWLTVERTGQRGMGSRSAHVSPAQLASDPQAQLC